jgi:uncharacterized protein (TIGR03067 family)
MLSQPFGLKKKHASKRSISETSRESAFTVPGRSGEGNRVKRLPPAGVRTMTRPAPQRRRPPRVEEYGMFAAFVALSLAASPAEPPKDKEKELPEAAQKELKKLEGKWKIVKSLDSTKEAEPDPKDPALFFVFKGNELTMEFGEKKEAIRITAIDPSTDPKCIDLTEKREGKPDRIIEGVYKIDGDKLLIALCITKDGKERPVSFDKPTDPRTVVWTLKRVKE